MLSYAPFSSTPKFTNHHQVLRRNQNVYLKGVQNGTIVPFTYPMFTIGAAILLVYFLSPQLHSRGGRYMTFALSAGWHIWMIVNCRAYGPSVGFGVGIVSAWGVLWAAVVLVFNDGAKDLKRVKREKVVVSSELFEVKNEASDRAVIRRRLGQGSGTDNDRLDAGNVLGKGHHTGARKITYRWQDYPLYPFIERIAWTIDLLTNFRGVGWNWKIPGLPSRPPVVQAALNASTKGTSAAEDRRIARSGIGRVDTYWSLVIHNVWLCIKGYIAIDIIKTVMNHDPYFWGMIDHAAPDYLPRLVQESFLLTRAYRLLLSMTMMWMCLRTIYSFGPLSFVGVLGTEWLGSNGEPWMYPDQYGSYFNVLDRGLAGWWGGWWHQVFRFAFQEGARWVCDVLHLKKKTFLRNTLQTVAAFTISGLLHASGSITMLGETRPWSGSFMFFFLQPLGILVEMIWKDRLKKAGVSNKIPQWLARTCNFVVIHIWFLATAPLLTDDFARGGIWHFDPLMLSVVRGLGFGVEGDGFFCWNGRLVAWHTDHDRWWRSGISF